jgi:hypothetical protein
MNHTIKSNLPFNDVSWWSIKGLAYGKHSIHFIMHWKSIQNPHNFVMFHISKPFIMPPPKHSLYFRHAKLFPFLFSHNVPIFTMEISSFKTILASVSHLEQWRFSWKENANFLIPSAVLQEELGLPPAIVCPWYRFHYVRTFKNTCNEYEGVLFIWKAN